VKPLDKKSSDSLRRLLYESSGVLIREEKDFLIENRLNSRLKRLGVSHYNEYFKILKSDKEEFSHFISLMTTHKTSFFRESDQFIHLKDWIKKARPSQLHLLSGACSSGEEVYSLAAYLESIQNESNFGYKILGIDICEKSICSAEKGVYQRGAEEIKQHQMHRYFDLDFQGNLQIKPELRKNLKFRQKNLLDLDLPKALRLDVVFLRNVLIYFDNKTIAKVLNNISRYQPKGGLLFLGTSEHIDSHLYQSIGASLYEKVV
jgi:chemotaxis protein methyltransferase CheR